MSNTSTSKGRIIAYRYHATSGRLITESCEQVQIMGKYTDARRCLPAAAHSMIQGPRLAQSRHRSPRPPSHADPSTISKAASTGSAELSLPDMYFVTGKRTPGTAVEKVATGTPPVMLTLSIRF